MGRKHEALAKAERIHRIHRIQRIHLGYTGVSYMVTVITYNKPFPPSKREATLLSNRSLVSGVHFDFYKVPGRPHVHVTIADVQMSL